MIETLFCRIGGSCWRFLCIGSDRNISANSFFLPMESKARTKKERGRESECWSLVEQKLTCTASRNSHSHPGREWLSPSDRWGDWIFISLLEVTQLVGGGARSQLSACLRLRYSPKRKLPPWTSFWAATKLLSVETPEEGSMGRSTPLAWAEEEQISKRPEDRQVVEAGQSLLSGSGAGCTVKGQATSPPVLIPSCFPKSHPKNQFGWVYKSSTNRFYAGFL